MTQRTNEVCLDRREEFPDDTVLKTVLGRAFSSYRDVVSLSGGFSGEWKFYGRKYGWQWKVYQKKKALFYLVPLKGGFRVGFAVRSEERVALLDSGLSDETKSALRMAKKYPEGYPLRFSVMCKADVKPVRLVIGVLTSMRSDRVHSIPA
jgi:hypothetical protein